MQGSVQTFLSLLTLQTVFSVGVHYPARMCQVQATTLLALPDPARAEALVMMLKSLSCSSPISCMSSFCPIPSAVVVNKFLFSPRKPHLLCPHPPPPLHPAPARRRAQASHAALASPPLAVLSALSRLTRTVPALAHSVCFKIITTNRIIDFFAPPLRPWRHSSQ